MGGYDKIGVVGMRDEDADGDDVGGRREGGGGCLMVVRTGGEVREMGRFA